MSKVVALNRYPVKGLSPEALPRIDVTTQGGLPFDREWAIALGNTEFDEEHPVAKSKAFFLTVMRFEALAALRTAYDHDSGMLTIRGHREAGDLEADLSTIAGREAVATFFETLLGAQATRGRPRLVRAAGHKFTDVSVASPQMMRSLSLINLDSVSELSKRCGFDLDPVRFRGNVMVSGIPAFSELEWLGQAVRIGTADFSVVRRTKRCAAINVDPGTGERGADLTEVLRREFGDTFWPSSAPVPVIVGPKRHPALLSFKKGRKMANIYEIYNKSDVSLRTLKKLDRLGFLKSDEIENPEIAKMICALQKGNRLSVAHRVMLIDEPPLLFKLGKYARHAKEQLDELGDAKGEAAKPAISFVIDQASRDQLNEVAALGKWMKRIIPADQEVSHHYVAVRALLGVSPDSRNHIAGQINRAFLNVRNSPDFVGWFTLKPTRHGNNVSFYHRPRLAFDL